ncbi:MAG TPA: cbb3-type cytochrome oxidase assembly protein CcoS [Polyangiaceae bacterium]|nr:cbb3-type cytochrome oxidase assembly protein CcoS [Polyangiaceae bacterium]
MTVLFVVFPLAVLLSGLAAAAFVWATGRGQFDDLDTPAVRLLCDDLAEKSPKTPAPRKEEEP